MSYRRLWRYGNYLLWALAGVCKTLRSINNQDILFCPLLLQDHNNRWNTRSKENVCRKTNNRINMILLNQITPNLSLIPAAEKNTVR